MLHRHRRLLCVCVALCMAAVTVFSPLPRPKREPAARVSQRPIAPAVPILRLPRPPALAPAGTPYRVTGGAGVALTFDDGPDPSWTPRILALLRRYQVKATFCLLGSRAGAHPALVRQIVRDGHTLCNHTMGHDLRLRRKPPHQIAADLRHANTAIAKAGGVTPKYFRAPGGKWAPGVVGTARSQGMASLDWAVDPQDWRRPPAGQIVASVRKNTRPGSIVLLHDAGGDRTQTYAALGVLLPDLRQRFTLVPL